MTGSSPRALMSEKAAKKKKKTTDTTAGPAEDGVCGGKKSRQSRGKGRRTRKDRNPGTGMGAGTSHSPAVTAQTTLTPADTPDTRSTPSPPPMEPELNRKCPFCSSSLEPVLDSAGQPAPLLQCLRCPAALPLCELCLYPCLNQTCTNRSCQLVAMLLTCELITDPSSHVKGCPLFRACPKCHSLMMHGSGCKYVFCAGCKYQYCFICLCIKEECSKDKNKYWSIKCSKPRAARQRFQT